MQKSINDIVIFLIIVSALILFLIGFIVTMLYLYKKRQLIFLQNIEQIKLNHEKNVLSIQLEVQEETFQHISREIHDNISLSLTLAKLQLNTLNWKELEKTMHSVEFTIGLLSNSIRDLSDISKSLNANIIIQQGLISAVENEINKIRNTGLLNINLDITGTPLYMDAQKELIIFRIVQEAFNNVIKHAKAKKVLLNFHYDPDYLHIDIFDNGRGFDTTGSLIDRKNGAGIKNMQARIKMLNGTMQLKSDPGVGTLISYTIPLIL